MTSFVKYIAVLAAALVATTVLAEKSDDAKATPTPKVKDGKDKKKKDKDKGSKATPAPVDPNATPAPAPKVKIPVIKDHPSKGLWIPYFDGTGKRQMDFQIAIAERMDEALLRLTDMDVQTYNEQGEKDMKINLPTSFYNTDTSAITTDYHVKITREDFQLEGETMIFYTNTKQGALGGGVRMLIYNLKENEETDANGQPKQSSKPSPEEDSRFKPDELKTPSSRVVEAPADFTPDKLTPLRH